MGPRVCLNVVVTRKIPTLTANLTSHLALSPVTLVTELMKSRIVSPIFSLIWCDPTEVLCSYLTLDCISDFISH
jgi:hypothetical protein